MVARRLVRQRLRGSREGDSHVDAARRTGNHGSPADRPRHTRIHLMCHSAALTPDPTAEGRPPNHKTTKTEEQPAAGRREGKEKGEPQRGRGGGKLGGTGVYIQLLWKRSLHVVPGIYHSRYHWDIIYN